MSFHVLGIYFSSYLKVFHSCGHIGRGSGLVPCTGQRFRGIESWMKKVVFICHRTGENDGYVEGKRTRNIFILRHRMWKFTDRRKCVIT